MGIDAEITSDVNQSQWKRWFNLLKAGRLIDIYTFLKKLFTYQQRDMDVILDNQTYHYKKVWFIVVANQPYFGGGVKIAPDARFDDGKFNILIVHTISPIILLSVFITVYWGGHL